jgi:hypothetical protein
VEVLVEREKKLTPVRSLLRAAGCDAAALLPACWRRVGGHAA